MKSFDFTNVESASSKGLTSPGTLDVFTITEVEFGISANGKDFMKVVFDNVHSSFNHRFYMSEGAMPRVQSLHKAVYNGEASTGDLTEAQIIAKFKGKKVALKVLGQVSSKDGKGYPDLGFGGFAKYPDNLANFVVSPKEQVLIDSALAAQVAQNAATPDTEVSSNGTGNVVPTGNNDDF